MSLMSLMMLSWTVFLLHTSSTVGMCWGYKEGKLPCWPMED
jgi:hypothetical protein